MTKNIEVLDEVTDRRKEMSSLGAREAWALRKEVKRKCEVCSEIFLSRAMVAFYCSGRCKRSKRDKIKKQTKSERYYKRTSVSGALNWHQRWTIAHDQMLDGPHTDFELAKMINRTIKAIQSRRYVLRRRIKT